MKDWRKPGARVKARAKNALLGCLAAIGRYEGKAEIEKTLVPANTVQFYGHRIGNGSECSVHEETRLVFKHKPPDTEVIKNLIYSETGLAWLNNRLVERFSVQPITVKGLFNSPPRKLNSIETCVVVECDFAYSYGDWTHCYLGTILSADYPDIPVLIPSHLARRDYVVRDLNRAGVRWIPAKGWTEIGEAIILRKQNPFFYWSAREADSYRKAFNVKPDTPDKKSITYFGRFNLVGETIPRPFPSGEIAEAIGKIGGRVVQQSVLTCNTAHLYEHQVETVIGDHGSGMLNILFWQPRNVIELVVGDWWVNNTLFVASSIGVKNFAVLRVDNLSGGEIMDLINKCITRFNAL